MAPESCNARHTERMTRNRWTGPDNPAYEVRGHHLLCAVCARGGCADPPPGMEAIGPLLQALWEYPYLSLKVTADLEVVRAHFLDTYAGRGERPLPPDFAARQADYDARRKDLEVLRVLGILPNTAIPAFWAYSMLFARQPTLDGLCRTGSAPSEAWPECPHARAGYYERIAQEGVVGDLQVQTEQGEALDGRGLWAMIRPRTREDMHEAKAESASHIMQDADHLYIRPAHLLCILCTAETQEPLIQDNLIELRRRMEQDPSIPVTLVEGCCMVCDSCNEYHAGENLCYHTHVKNQLRDLMFLERLGLPPGATLPAGELFRLIYDRLDNLKQVCGWRDGSNTAMFWSPCGYERPIIEEAREQELLTCRPAAD